MELTNLLTKQTMPIVTYTSKLRCIKYNSEITVIIYANKPGEKWWCKKCNKCYRKAIIKK